MNDKVKRATKKVLLGLAATVLTITVFTATIVCSIVLLDVYSPETLHSLVDGTVKTYFELKG